MSYEKKHEVSVNGVLKKLSVSSSGYYSWKNREKPSRRELERETIKEEIKEIYEKSNKVYGAPKITKELEKKGRCVSQKTVSKYMKAMDLRAIWVRKYKASRREKVEDELKDILKREFNPPMSNMVWVTDITYIYTDKGFVYLSSVMDLYSRKIISWEVSDRLTVEIVLRTINKAKSMRKLDRALIIHSDRGSQYTSGEYEKVTSHPQISRSYSRKGNPWDNAVIESFHSLIKREWLNRYRIRDLSEARGLIFEYIETFYNTRRIHSHCGMLSPDEFEKKFKKYSA